MIRFDIRLVLYIIYILPNCIYCIGLGFAVPEYVACLLDRMLSWLFILALLMLLLV